MSSQPTYSIPSTTVSVTAAHLMPSAQANRHTALQVTGRYPARPNTASDRGIVVPGAVRQLGLPGGAPLEDG
ncbi:hypothetical protein GCM10010381_57930 [Streptomyces xantholiticus]|nr:hypothetical protein GCM10010381_57930 [Streptomyces xantholiticus]